MAASNRQAEIAAETLSLLRKQIDQQFRTDVAAVALQLKVAIHVIEDWLKRIASDKHPQLPDEIVILPVDFNIATQRAHSIDHIAAENMGAAALYVTEAETNLKILRTVAPDSQGSKEVQEKAAKSLNTAKYKLSVARTRWEAHGAHQRLDRAGRRQRIITALKVHGFPDESPHPPSPQMKASLAEFRPSEQGDSSDDRRSQQAHRRLPDS